MEVGDILKDNRGNIAIIKAVYPLTYSIKYWTGTTTEYMNSAFILSRFTLVTELEKALL